MSSEKRSGNLLIPTRRQLLGGIAALSATAALAPRASAQALPTATVNTTGLAVTDSEVTVGILHSITGTMAISETGSVDHSHVHFLSAGARRLIFEFSSCSKCLFVASPDAKPVPAFAGNVLTLRAALRGDRRLYHVKVGRKARHLSSSPS